MRERHAPVQGVAFLISKRTIFALIQKGIMDPADNKQFAPSLFKYCRQQTAEIRIGNITLGGDSPIRVQSMTTTDTNDIDASVEQCLRIVEAGGEIVRLTTQGEREARSIGRVEQALRGKGCTTPLVADVHFNPNAAITAAALVEAVRINPGNYTGEAKRFCEDADKMTDNEWHDLIVQKLRPLVDTCKAHGTALRIGVNHGSLSDRIMAKHGDTPQGMVASCTEYIDALEELDFHDIAISIKSSNMRVMVETVRLLAATLRRRGVVYPLHLGVTEAGSDAEGRIKSAAGIGALLNDGLGDTVRVSLTEAPEAEIPVAQALVRHCARLQNAKEVSEVDTSRYSPFAYQRRTTRAVANVGGGNAPAILSLGPAPTGQDWVVAQDLKSARNASVGTLKIKSLPEAEKETDGETFIRLTLRELMASEGSALRRGNVIVMGECETGNPQAEMRALSLELTNRGIEAPFVPLYRSERTSADDIGLEMAADLGGLLIDGLADGVCVIAPKADVTAAANAADILLQATHARFSRTEFISCPGCGRTLYDIQDTVALIKEQFGHLKGLKIGVMGCIVNGIGEMADADYGYVGAGRGKISLYRGKEVIRRSIDQSEALDILKQIIKADGKWAEPQN